MSETPMADKEDYRPGRKYVWSRQGMRENYGIFTSQWVRATDYEALQAALTASEADRDAHRQAAHEADMRTQAAVRAEKAAESRCAELVRDAERYRWLRSYCCEDEGDWWSDLGDKLDAEFDAAIDSAKEG